MGKKLTEIEAAIRVKMSPGLLRWFTGHAPKHGSKRKLPFTDKGGEYFYDSDQLDEFNAFLKEPWPIPPGQTRPTVPDAIEREIKIEAHHKCAFCEYNANGESAHIDAVAKSKCNHPHNLIWTCPTHHTEYDRSGKQATQITKEQVKVLKSMLLERQLIHWRIALRGVSAILALINELEAVLGYLRDPKLAEIKISLEAQARSIVASVNAVAKKKGVAEPKSPPHYENYLKRIVEITKVPPKAEETSVEDVLEEVAEATDEYLHEEALSKCPLCKGTGVHNRFRCHVCAGEGTVPTAALPEIDLRPYKQVDCPLCEGSGTHNRLECPVCFDVGTVDKAALDQIDLKPFKQTDCPLCEGKGTHNRLECPICNGVGTIDRRDGGEIDLSPFKQTDCPLCEGKGTRKGGFECAVCHGVGTIDRRAEDELDLSAFKQVECPLCEGSRRFKGEECPVCRGDGEIDRGYADNLDLNGFL